MERRTATIAICLIEGVSLFPVLTELVILLTLLGVANHLISLVQSLELSLGLGVIGVKIGVELLSAFQESATHILLRNIAVDAKNLIIINKCHSYKSSIR